MRTNTIHPTPRSRRLAGFTIVELLVVIAIIALLVGITVPTVSAVKNVAKAGATKALLHSIGTGLDMFKIESKLGRTYPPSRWDTMGDGDPYGNGMGNYVAQGAQTLVWGLAGADLLGTPGFQINPTGGTYLNRDTGGLYQLDNGRPVKARFGPYMDLSKTKLKTPPELDRPVSGTGDFDKAPVIADNFGLAVLYYAPDPTYSDTRMFHWTHNSQFMDSSDTLANDTKLGWYVLDHRAKDLTGINVPQNRDSYLLITAGPDGQYGTRDDVTNFDPSAQTLP